LVENTVNNKYEILTPDGWRNFVGVRKSTGSSYIKITTKDNSVKCSIDHRVLTQDGYKEASSISKGCSLITDCGPEQIIDIESIEEPLDLYDAIEVDTHEYITNGFISHNCDFIGSTNTLISSHKIHSLAWVKPKIQNSDGLAIYDDPIEGHTYVITVDTSRGQGKDYSAFCVIDITDPPYKVVAKYRNNLISPMVYPTVIKRLAEQFNNAFCLVEINDIGGQVADVLYSDLEYENVLMTSHQGRKGQTISGGFGKGGVQFGVRTSQVVKKLGCSVLKSLLEEDKMIVEDQDIVNELTTFVAKKQSYEADDGHNDDLVMCLVLFGWLTRQEYFKNLTNIDVRTDIYQDKIDQLEEDMSPFGFIDNGSEEDGVWDGKDRWFSDKDDTKW